MDENTLFLTNQEIYRRFPYLKDIQPMQKTLPDGNFQLTYSANAETENGIMLPITIRVKISPAGKILGISTSK